MKNQENETLQRIGVIGLGQMGIGIANLFLSKGFQVFLFDAQAPARGTAISRLTDRLIKSLQLTGPTDDRIHQFLNRLHLCDDLKDFRQADLVIEAVSEDLNIKKDVYQTLEEYITPHCIVASNTSSLSIEDLAKSFSRPERFLGLHFFNPVWVLPLVELIAHEKTTSTILNQAQSLMETVGKTPIVCKDSFGFIVNRLLLPMINQACHLLDQGVAKVEDIDTAMKLGANFPMGPLALGDFIGLDVVVAILNTFFEKTGDPFYKPARCLLDCVQKGHLGRKSGQGLYTYPVR